MSTSFRVQVLFGISFIRGWVSAERGRPVGECWEGCVSRDGAGRKGNGARGMWPCDLHAYQSRSAARLHSAICLACFCAPVQGHRVPRRCPSLASKRILFSLFRLRSCVQPERNPSLSSVLWSCLRISLRCVRMRRMQGAHSQIVPCIRCYFSPHVK